MEDHVTDLSHYHQMIRMAYQQSDLTFMNILTEHLTGDNRLQTNVEVDYIRIYHEE
jgi:hypothetical protein